MWRGDVLFDSWLMFFQGRDRFTQNTGTMFEMYVWRFDDRVTRKDDLRRA